MLQGARILSAIKLNTADFFATNARIIWFLVETLQQIFYSWIRGNCIFMTVQVNGADVCEKSLLST